MDKQFQLLFIVCISLGMTNVHAMEQELPPAKKQKKEEEVIATTIIPESAGVSDIKFIDIKFIVEEQSIYSTQTKTNETLSIPVDTVDLNQKEHFSSRPFKELMELRFSQKLPFIIARITEYNFNREYNFYFDAYSLLHYVFGYPDILVPISFSSLPAQFDKLLQIHNFDTEDFAKKFLPEEQYFYLDPVFELQNISPELQEFLLSIDLFPPYKLSINRYVLPMDKFPPNPVTNKIITGRIKFYAITDSSASFYYRGSDYDLSNLAPSLDHQSILGFIGGHIPPEYITNPFVILYQAKRFNDFANAAYMNKNYEQARTYFAKILDTPREKLATFQTNELNELISTALYRMAETYEREFNKVKAFEYLKQAADEFENPKAQLAVADYLIYGLATPKNYEVAHAYLDKLVANPKPEAEFDKPNAFIHFATLYSSGFGVAENIDLALEYLNQAASQETNLKARAHARYLLGKWYQREGDLAKAKELMQDAANQTQNLEIKAKASFFLGKLYLQEGVYHNLDEAKHYLNFVAKEQGILLDEQQEADTLVNQIEKLQKEAAK